MMTLVDFIEAFGTSEGVKKEWDKRGRKAPKASGHIEKLQKAGIKNTADLDRYIKAHPKTDKDGNSYLDSRYSTLVDLVGENAATWIMHELATQSLDLPGKK